MTALRFIPLEYHIALGDGQPGSGFYPLRVKGYAVGGDTPLRICVRKVGDRWRADHFDSGCSIGGYKQTREAAARCAVANCLAAALAGKLKTALRKVNSTTRRMRAYNVVHA